MATAGLFIDSVSRLTMRHYPLLLPPNSPLIAWPALMSGFQIQNFHSFHFHFQSYSWKSSGSFEQLHLLTDERSTKPWPQRSNIAVNLRPIWSKNRRSVSTRCARPRFADDHRDRFLALLVRGLDDPVGGGRNICLTTREGDQDQGCRNCARWCG